MSLTVLAKTSEIVWALLESYDIDPLPSFEDAGIDPALRNHIGARIDQAKMDKLWRNAAERSNDPCFGLRAAQLWHPSYLHALGYAWLASPTLRSALERLVRFTHLVAQATETSIEESDDQLIFSWMNHTRTSDDYWHANATMAILITMCRANYGDDLDPAVIRFTHAQPERTGDFYDLFRCPVEFDAPSNQLIIAKQAADKILPGSNHLMEQINDQEIIKYLARLDKNDIIHQVQATIISQLHDGEITDSAIAEALYMSNRTLQRRLEKQETTFVQVLTGVRKNLALKYIQDSELTLTELSFQLGFSELSAFSRAFKNWTGKSPSQFREENQSRT